MTEDEEVAFKTGIPVKMQVHAVHMEDLTNFSLLSKFPRFNQLS